MKSKLEMEIELKEKIHGINLYTFRKKINDLIKLFPNGEAENVINKYKAFYLDCAIYQALQDKNNIAE